MRKPASSMPSMSALSERRVMPPHPQDGLACRSPASSSSAHPSGALHSNSAVPVSWPSAHASGSMPSETTSSSQLAMSARPASRCLRRTTDLAVPAFEIPHSWPLQNDFVVWLVAFHAVKFSCSRSSSMSTRAAGLPRAFFAARIS